jgi:benzoate transport
MTKPCPPVDEMKSNNQDFFGSRPMTLYQVFVVFMCFILNMNDGIDVLVVSYTAPEIMMEWGISKGLFGYVFSSGLAGMTLGCLLLAPLADRIGRRRLFIIALLVESVAMILSSQAMTFNQLLTLRFLAGLGIGGLLPAMAAVASEISSNRRKDLSVGFVQAGWPIGAILMGFFTAWIVPEFGWRSAYLSAGLASAVMFLMVVIFMPESVDYLIKKQPLNGLQRINRVLEKAGVNRLDTLPEAEELKTTKNISPLSPQYRTATIRLWVGVFFGFITLYTLISWVPTIASEAGMPFEMSTYVGTVLNIGAFIGSTGIGWLASKFRIKGLILVFFLIAFGVMIAYGTLPLTNGIIFLLTFLIGIFVQGGFNGYWPAASRIYPAQMRTTGIGWAVGVGRFGAVLGPLLFGVMSDAQLSTGVLFFIFSLPLLVSGIAVFSIPPRILK